MLATSLSVITPIACAGRHPPFDYAAEPDPRAGEFVIGASDAVKITVWKNPELSIESKVRPDGTLTMPLLGDIKVQGNTPSQVKAEVARRLVAYVKDESATVTVAVTEVNSYRFTVAGNVERPGVYGARQYVTVGEAIALAGGPNRFASPRDTVVVRLDASAQPRKIPVDYAEVRAGDRLEQNIVVLPGDTVFVP